MAEKSLLWDTNGTGDGTGTGYTESDMIQLFRSLFTRTSNLGGVVPDYLNELAVTGTATPVSINTGAALVYGIPYFNTASVDVAIATPAVSTRVDRIVLRADWTLQTARITRIAGTEGAGTPAMTQSAGTTWDIPLATVSITTGGVITVTDAREWLLGTGDLTIDSSKLASNAVTTAKITDANVTAAKLATDAVTTVKITDSNVTTAKIADSNVTAAKIADSNVTTAKIADSNVTTAKIADANVTTAKILDANVTTAKILDANVTTAKIAADAVTTAKILDSNVTTAKIADANVTQAKLGADTLQIVIFPLGAQTIVETSTSYVTEGPEYASLTFDKDKFPAGATVKLIAVGAKNGGGTGYVQLYNATDSVAIANTESAFAGSAAYAESTDFAADLPSGSKAYRVQAKQSAGTNFTIYRLALKVEW